MNKYVRNISKDPTKPGLHFKVVVDTTKTKQYAKRFQRMGPKALRDAMFHILRQESQKAIKDMMNDSVSDSGNLALKKIAGSVRISDKTSGFDTIQDKNTVAMSMWSQRGGASGFTPKGVQGSRGGYLAQIYEVGTGGGFSIFGGKANHPGWKGRRYFKKTKDRVMARVNETLTSLEDDLRPDDEPKQTGEGGYKSTGTVGRKEFEALKAAGVL
jgi:hypothetical protein|tara:strand:- start:8465 stop:9106 length:642 start_codon:yes stop_codon:yes gene_type:complete